MSKLFFYTYQEAIEALTVAGLIEAEAMSQAEDVVAQAEAVAAAALADAENNEDDDGSSEVGEPA